MSARLIYVGGPTAIIEFGGLRLLTDPTFDPKGSEYRTPLYVLRKTADPALSSQAVGAIDVVLLSHDHHFDNLDHEGRRFLATAGLVLTTTDGARRLGGRAIGLEPWQEHDIAAGTSGTVHVVATPARHGPAGGDRGPVIGFVLSSAESPDQRLFVTGDSVWYEGIADVQKRFAPNVVVIFAGAARVREVGPAHLTFTAEEVVEAARTFSQARIVPLHYEGWGHFSEPRADLQRAFDAAGLTSRLRFPAAGFPIELL